MKFAVIGSGITGLSAASRIVRAGHDVVVYESGDHVGGHADTVPGPGGHECDVGFMVCNRVTYPNMLNWFDEHGVELQPSDMTFAVSCRDGWMEWSSKSPFAQKSNLVNPDFWGMLKDLGRFGGDVDKFCDGAAAGDESVLLPGTTWTTLTLAAWMDAHGYGEYFVNQYVLPMCSAVWSCPTGSAASFPAVMILRFIKNHHLHYVFERPQWITVAERSQRGYVRKVAAPFWDKIRLNTAVTSVTSVADSERDSGFAVTVKDAQGGSEVFDGVVMAAHAPDTLNMLGDGASDEEREVLGAFPYQENSIYLHQDASMMPQRKAAWSAWNFMTNAEDEVYVSYWLNELQGVPTVNNMPTLVTLNPSQPPKYIVKHWKTSHPVPTLASHIASQRLDSIQGCRGITFGGAWAGSGFHEDGFKAGAAAAAAILGQGHEWTPIPHPVLMKFSWMESAARWLTLYTLHSLIGVGRLEVRETGGTVVVFAGKESSGGKHVYLTVHRPSFYSKVALGAGAGMNQAYEDGDVTVAPSMDDLLKLMTENAGHATTESGWKRAVAAAIGRIMSIFGGLQAESAGIKQTPVSQELFSTFLALHEMN